jgi:hypothetical protein
MKSHTDAATLCRIDALMSEAILLLRQAYQLLPPDIEPAAWQDLWLREDLHDLAEGQLTARLLKLRDIAAQRGGNGART